MLWSLISIFSACGSQETRYFVTTYSELSWENIGHYDAMFHTHPGLGNEQYDPQETIDRYYEEGYKILTIAGHDYDIPSEIIPSIYPWTNLSVIYEQIHKVQNPTEDNKTYEEMAKGPYQDRNPIDLDMVSVEGCEISGPHHLIALFCSFSEGQATEAETLREITNRDGLAYFAHPGRYTERWGVTAYWYADLYQRFEILLGQAVFNGEDRYPQDRGFFDRVAHLLGHERPIWMFAEDDMHTEEQLGWNRNIVLLPEFLPGSIHESLPDGSAPKVKEALKKGWFYIWKPDQQYERRMFSISKMSIDTQEVKISVDQEEKVIEFRWQTYDPQKKVTKTIGEGSSLSLRDVPSSASFIRLEISGEGGTIYTQPIYIQSKN